MSFKIADGHVEVHAKHNRASTRRSAQEAVDEAERVGRNNEGSLLKWLFKVNPSLMRLLEAPIGSIFGSPIMFAAAATLAGILGGAISAAISTAVLVGIGGGLIAAGAFALRKNKELRKEWEQATTAIGKMFERASKPLLGPLIDGINYFEKRIVKLEPTFKRLFTLTGPLVKPAIDMLVGLIEGMLPGIERAMPGIQTVFDTLAKHMPGLGTAIGDFFATIAENGPLLERVVGLLITWLEIFFKVLGPILVEGMRSFATAADMWNFFTDAVVKGVEWIGETWGKIPGWWNASWGAVSGFFTELWDDISGFFSNLGSGTSDTWTSVTDSIKNTWQGVVDWFSNLPGVIGNAIMGIPGYILSVFQFAFDSLFYMIGFASGLVVKAFTDLPVAIWNVTQTGIALVIGVFQAAMDKIVGNVKTSFWAIVNFIPTAFSAFMDVVNAGWALMLLSFKHAVDSAVWTFTQLGPKMWGIAKDAWNRVVSFFVNGAASAIGIVKNFPMNAYNAIKGLRGQFEGAGKDAIRGLVNGIENMMGWAIDKARRAASRIADGFKDALGIGSPSKVMADEVGHWIPPGVVQGAEDNMGVVDDMLSKFPSMLPASTPNHAEQRAMAASQDTNYGGVTVNVSVQNIAELQDILAFLDGQLADRTKLDTWAGNLYEAQGKYERSYR